MRGVAVALALLALAVPAAGGRTAEHARVAFLRSGDLVVLDLATREQHVVLANAGPGPVRWSGDSRLVASGGRVARGPSLPTKALSWAPTGETAAYLSEAGAVVVWSPTVGRRTIVPASWGARSIAWGPDGRLALARYVCHPPCGVPEHQEVWVWRAGNLRRAVGPLRGIVLPIVSGFTPDGRVLWWADPQGSASLAADGLALYANHTRLATTLVYEDFVAACGPRLALAAGGIRDATLRKRILLDGRDVSRDATRSWISPSCSADGTTLVSAASRSRQVDRFGFEHRAIWQLLPERKQLTQPPSGWTDESPRVVADGSILFVRTHQTVRKMGGQWRTTQHGTLQLLAGAKLVTLADVTFGGSPADLFNYYGHYDWPSRLALAP